MATRPEINKLTQDIIDILAYQADLQKKYTGAAIDAKLKEVIDQYSQQIGMNADKLAALVESLDALSNKEVTDAATITAKIADLEAEHKTFKDSFDQISQELIAIELGNGGGSVPSSEITKAIQKLQDKVNSLDDKIAQTTQDLKDKINAKIDNVKQLIDDKTDNVKQIIDNKISQVNDRQDAINGRIDDVVSQIDDRIQKINDREDEIVQQGQDALTEIKTEIADIKEQVKTNNLDIQEIKDRLNGFYIFG